MNFTIDDLEDVIEAAEDHPDARGSEIHWFSSKTTYGLGKIYCIVDDRDDERMAFAYIDISEELFGDPNALQIMEDYFGEKPTMVKRIR